MSITYQTKASSSMTDRVINSVYRCHWRSLIDSVADVQHSVPDGCARQFRLGQIPNLPIRCNIESYPTRFNSIRFMHTILISSTINSFSIGHLPEVRKSCVSMIWGDARMSTLLEMATFVWENYVRFGINAPENPSYNFDDSLYW